ncbi:MAG: hypothetical protein CMP39_05060, partial [Rickettsiales bacterium]|nr:hypothetical protein [Rickettsiales bacterium]
MAELSFIIKRNGEKQLFDSDRIFTAINKAFISETINDSEKVLSLTKEVVELTDMIQNERSNYVSVEEVQDLVEQTLMNHGLHKIARSYIIYRDRQKYVREEETLIKVKENQLTIRLENDETIIYNPESIESKLIDLTDGLEKVSISELVENITKQVYDNIPIEEVNQIILNSTREKIEQHYQYSSLASRLTLEQLYNDVLNTSLKKDNFIQNYQAKFKDYINEGIKLELLNDELADFDLEKMSTHIKPNRDLLFHYLGIQILVDRYFIQNRDFKTIELPQWFWLRVSMGLALKEKNKEEKAIEFYNVLSKMDLVSSTPTLFNSGTRFSQMSSCYLNISEDSLEGIFKLFSDN